MDSDRQIWIHSAIGSSMERLPLQRETLHSGNMWICYIVVNKEDNQ